MGVTPKGPRIGPITDEAAAVVLLARAVERLAGATTITEVAAIVRSAARRLSGADGIAIVLRDGDKVHYIDEDAVGPLWKGGIFPIDACISGWAMLHRRQVVIEDIFLDPRIPHHLYEPTFVKSCVMTPVGEPEPLACIGAYWATTRLPTERELAGLDAIARATSVELENIHLHRSLRSAVRRAEAANRAKIDFLANMSHEIRTPLNGVMGASALLAAASVTPDQARLVEMIQASGAELERVLKDILDFARLQQEAASIEIGPFHVGEALRETAALFALRFVQRGIDFRVEIDPAADRAVLGDRGAVKQLAANLIQNALKFTNAGHATVSLTAGEGDMIRLAVQDTGIGIELDAQQRIFEGFELGDASSTRSLGGSGLGLAISRRLAELMGGGLTVESAPGAGSTFTAMLDLPPAPPEAVPPKAEPTRLPTLRILVVDDHPVNRALVSALLEAIEVETVEAADGRQACETFAAQPFAAVLMDIQMPIMDGISATRRIRELERKAGVAPTPIIMLSANTLPEHVEASRAAGADRHLAKPVSPHQLYAALKDAVVET